MNPTNRSLKKTAHYLSLWQKEETHQSFYEDIAQQLASYIVALDTVSDSLEEADEQTYEKKAKHLAIRALQTVKKCGDRLQESPIRADSEVTKELADEQSELRLQLTSLLNVIEPLQTLQKTITEEREESVQVLLTMQDEYPSEIELQEAWNDKITHLDMCQSVLAETLSPFLRTEATLMELNSRLLRATKLWEQATMIPR